MYSQSPLWNYNIELSLSIFELEAKTWQILYEKIMRDLVIDSLTSVNISDERMR